ncbi:uncharacterized protein LTR77_005744 [Saxophila tyrrhenica]|uniref:Uncharacterized protein n=1 Tax=Saxophila tyrrhenica TaxID=1690608 RepID=A0AAV9P9L2_9PEZI|nr:hypothetical protein LTR77_005744 [Saxophila tyrrhenica]
MDTTPPNTSNAGLIWANSKPTNPETLTPDAFSKWYNDVHIPDVLKTGAVTEAYRYEAIDPIEDKYHLAIYSVEDMDGLGEKLKPVPQDPAIFQNAHFDTRFYKLVQRYESKDSGKDQPSIVLSTEMTPGDVEDYDRWYRGEHLQDGSKVRGWRRTERYELLQALRVDDAPRFLVLFFLDGDEVPMEDMQKAGGSEWTKKVVGGMKQFRSAGFRRAAHHVAKI